MSKPGTFQKGQSGNPAGRPPKKRALTEILEKAGNKTIEVDGHSARVARKRIVAELAWQLATVGCATMPDGKKLRLDPKDWIGLVKWIYQHIDGPPRTEMELTGAGGGPLAIELGAAARDSLLGRLLSPSTGGDEERAADAAHG